MSDEQNIIESLKYDLLKEQNNNRVLQNTIDDLIRMAVINASENKDSLTEEEIQYQIDEYKKTFR